MFKTSSLGVFYFTIKKWSFSAPGKGDKIREDTKASYYVTPSRNQGHWLRLEQRVSTELKAGSDKGMKLMIQAEVS